MTDLWFRLAKTRRPERLDPQHAVGWLVLSLMVWVIYAFAFTLLVAGLGLPAPMPSTGSAFAASYVLGYVMVFAPAGLGVREGFLVALLSPQMGAAAAGAVAVIARLWTTIVEVVPAAAFWARHLARSPEAPQRP